MRTSDTILGLLRERGSKGLPLERVYRLLYNPDLYLTAYGKIYRNHGAMTKGTTDETVDGMSLSKIATIIQALRDGTFQWPPVRRVYIPKKQGKMRPLGDFYIIPRNGALSFNQASPSPTSREWDDALRLRRSFPY